MTLKDLKEKMEGLLEQVEDEINCYGESTEVKIKGNTYFCKGEYMEIYRPERGFVDFEDLTRDEDEEW